MSANNVATSEVLSMDPARAQAIEDSLAMLVAVVEMMHKKNVRPSGERVNVSYVILSELDKELERVLVAIEVSEALGHRVEVEIDRQGAKNPMLVGLQFFTHVPAAGSS